MSTNDSKAIVTGAVAFNKAWVAKKSFKDFCEHEKHHGLSKEQLREVYDACVKEVKGKAPAKPADDTSSE